MNAADTVPGVSGDTITLITGTYERLVSTIVTTTPGRIKCILGVVISRCRTDAVATMREIDVGSLLALGAGIVTAIVTAMHVLHVVLDDVPVSTYDFFFGLTAASVVVLYAQVSLDDPRQVTAAVVGFGLAFVVSGGSGSTFGHPLPVIAVAGGITVSAMILLGVSGSLILLILGQYEHMNMALNAFINDLLGVTGGAPLLVVVEPGTVVVTFMVGTVAGLFSIAHVVRQAFEHYRRATLALLMSLIVGALHTPVVESITMLVDVGRSRMTEFYAAFAVATVVGATIVPLVNRYTDAIES